MAELAVKLIRARSPQAKGRVERRNRTLQDRLVKELRLRKIHSLPQANAFLESRYLAELNDKLAIDPRRNADLHRPPTRNVPLEEVLCVSESRVVSNDWCVRWQNRWLQIDASHSPLALPGRRVRVREKLDGKLLLDYQGRRLTCEPIGQRPPAKRPAKPVVVNNRSWKPPGHHPWRQPASMTARSTRLPG